MTDSLIPKWVQGEREGKEKRKEGKAGVPGGRIKGG